MIRQLATELLVLAMPAAMIAQMRAEKPPLHAAHCMAITGKPLSATAGAACLPDKASPGSHARAHSDVSANARSPRGGPRFRTLPSP